ncbi:unnamed protein product [Camellia sinensis]
MSTIESVLDWHHSNLRRGAAAAEGEKLLFASLAKIESIWLKGNGHFLLGSSQYVVDSLSSHLTVRPMPHQQQSHTFSSQEAHLSKKEKNKNKNKKN